MSINEAKLIINEYGLNTDEDTLEIVLDALNKFGSAKNVLIEGLKEEYKYLKKISKLLAMLNEKQTSDLEADTISTLMHDIYARVSKDSQSRGEDFDKLMRQINVRKTFNPSEMELWVMNYLGGRKLISKIQYQEPNQLIQRIKFAIKKYELLPELSSTLAIQNTPINTLLTNKEGV